MLSCSSGQLSAATRSNGTKFGIIYDGGLSDTTGPAWTTAAEALFVWVEQNQAMVPDDGMSNFRRWDPQPDHALPGTQPDSDDLSGQPLHAAAKTYSSPPIQFPIIFQEEITSQGIAFEQRAGYPAYAMTQTGWRFVWAGPTNASGMFALKLAAPVPVVRFRFHR